MPRLLFVAIITFFLPVSAQASVIINEIAWMGGVNSANHEWIELYNSGSEAVLVDGWVLDDGLNLGISLAGSIPASSYVVLERSSDESSPASAFLIYTGALVNTGATLTLKNANGEIMDQVAGGENWQEIGGDNTNKDTAQYTTKGWVTDSPTPKAQNRSGRVEPAFTEEVAETTKTTTKSASTAGKVVVPEKVRSLSLVTPNTVLKLSIDTQDVAYVNQEVPFKVEAKDIGDTLIDSLVYTWNFGDSYSKTGKEVNHTFSYPGTYVVTVNAKYARHDETIRQEITILPVSFSITKNEFGDIQIHNDSPYDVDMSGFSVKGESEVVFPPKTIILPKSTITIAKKRLGLGVQEKQVSLYDYKGTVVASSFDNLFSAPALIEEEDVLVSANTFLETKPVILNKSLPKPTMLAESDFVVDFTNEALASEEVVENDFVITSSTNETNDNLKSNDTNKPSNERWPYVVFVCLIILSLFGIYISRR